MKHQRLKSQVREGVKHEIDVLARKDLERVTFRIGVECKNWKNTVGKDVVERYVTRWLETIKHVHNYCKGIY